MFLHWKRLEHDPLTTNVSIVYKPVNEFAREID